MKKIYDTNYSFIGKIIMTIETIKLEIQGMTCDSCAKTIEKKLNELELEEKILSRSKLTQRDIDKIAHKIKKEVFQELNGMWK